MREKGQVVLILILIMSVALTIGLAIVQKSLVDVSTSSKAEQSSRAFSAAEAGVEKALKESETTAHLTDPLSFSGNNSQVKEITDTGLIPPVPVPGSQQNPLEIPPLAKEEVTQVWLADFNSYSNPPNIFYNQNTLDIYFGNSPADKDPVAIEVTLIYHDGTKYTSKKWFLDQISRTPANGFEVVSNCAGNYQPPGGLSAYQCKKTLGASPDTPLPSVLPSALILLRARLLYNTTSQPFALQAVACPPSVQTCINYSIPPQGRIIVATGASGETERRVKVFQLDKVLPPYFDYAIFSAGEITK